jgi:hypothetical protein
MRALVVRTQWRCNRACPANQLARVSGADPTNPLEKPRESTKNHTIPAGSRLPQHVPQASVFNLPRKPVVFQDGVQAAMVDGAPSLMLRLASMNRGGLR